MKPVGKALSASIHSLGKTLSKRQAQEATQLELLLRKVADPATASRYGSAYAALFPDPTRSQDPFVMVTAQQNSIVTEWLVANSKRPLVAVRLWSLLFTAIRTDTNEIVLNRQQIADRLSVRPQEISAAMTELASINAVVRQRQGKEVRYRMNSGIATHLPSEVLREEARAKDGPLMVLMQGGRREEALDASV